MKKLMTAAGICITLTLCVSAATLTWDGSESANWSDPNNWVEGVAPVSNDSVILVSAGTPPTNQDIPDLVLNVLTFSNTVLSMTLDGLPLTVGYIRALRSGSESAETYTIMPNVRLSQSATAWIVQSRSTVVLEGQVGQTVPGIFFSANENGNIIFKNTNTFSGGFRNNQTVAHFYQGDQALGPAPVTNVPVFFQTGFGSWRFRSDLPYVHQIINTNRGMRSTGTARLDPDGNVRVIYNGTIIEDAANKGIESRSTGWWVLGGNNTFSGNVGIGNAYGVIKMNHPNALGQGIATARISLYGTVDVNGHDLPTRWLSSNNGSGYLGAGMLINSAEGTTSEVNGYWINGTTPGTMFGGGGNIIMTSYISGGNPVVKVGTGDLTFSGQNAATNNTSVRGGTLIWDYTAQNVDKLLDGRKLYLNQGRLRMVGNNSAPTVEQMGDLDAQTEANRVPGANAVTLLAGENQNLTLSVSNILVARGDTMLFALVNNGSGVAKIETTRAVGPMQGNAVLNKTTYATIAAGLVAGLGDGDYSTDFATSTVDSFMEVDTTTLSANATAMALRFKNAAATTLTIDSGRTLNLPGSNGGNLGGILVTPGAGRVEIVGGALSPGLNQWLHIHQYSENPLLIGSLISHNSNSIIKDGDGELIITNGANGYSTMRIGRGTVSVYELTNRTLASPLGLGTPELADGTLRYLGEDVACDRMIALRGAGTLDASGAGTVRFTTNGIFMTPSVGSARVTLAGTSTGIVDGIFDLRLGGISKTGPGTWLLNSTNTYHGDTLVQSGTLIVKGDTGYGDVRVTGGTFGGNVRNAGSLTVQAGGTIAPGASIGTASFEAVIMEAGSVYEWEVSSGNSADMLEARSFLQLPTAANSVTIRVVRIDSPLLTDTNTVVKTGQITDGDLNSIALVFAPGLSAGDVFIDGNEIKVTNLIPEPGVLGVLGLAALAVRKRR